MKVGESIKHDEYNCLACKKPNNAIMGVADGAGHLPKAGDMTVCICCGYVMAFDEKLAMRELTPKERDIVSRDHRIHAIQIALREVRGKPCQ